MNKLKIGISQGRLIKPPNNELQWFPGPKWKEEFLIAKKIGLNHIEFLAEIKHNPSNPIWTKKGRDEIKACSREYEIQNYSACYDYLIENTIIDDFSINSHLYIYTKKFIDACSELNLKMIILPLLGNNNLNNLNMERVRKFLEIVIPYAFNKKIFISIESLADPILITELLKNFLNYSTGCVYDTGNRVLLSNDQENDILSLSQFIKHIHIKDKNKINENVILGNGIVDFEKIFSGLRKINYKGIFTMETNRGEDPLKTAINNIKLIKKFL